MFKKIVPIVLSIAVFAMTFPLMAKDKIEPPSIADDARNPPPKVALNDYARFELMPVALGAPFNEYETNTVAKEKLQANLDERAKPLVAQWNARSSGDGQRTLRIEPKITYIRFITGGKRFFGGAFAGKSAILVTMTLTDAASGEVVAEPQFYQHANAFGAAYSFGGTDKHMLIRISGMVTDYLETNYDSPVGGAVAVAPGHEDPPKK